MDHTFFWASKAREILYCLTDLTLRELIQAPEGVRKLTETIPDQYIELSSLTEEAEILASHYISDGVSTPKFESDAQHMAMATILKVDSVVSWNFKHRVNFFRIKQNNSINLKLGYQTIDIRTPKEVIYGNED